MFCKDNPLWFNILLGIGYTIEAALLLLAAWAVWTFVLVPISHPLAIALAWFLSIGLLWKIVVIFIIVMAVGLATTPTYRY